MATLRYIDEKSVGDTDNYDSPWMGVYKTDPVPSSYLDKAYDFCIKCLDDLYGGGHISGYTIEKRAVENWNIKDNCDGDGGVLDIWNNKRTQDLNATHDGGHCCIHEASTDCASPGRASGGGAWYNDVSQVARTTAGGGGYRKEKGVAGTCFHEYTHSFVYKNCDNVSEYLEDDDEHSLGVIKEIDGTDKETPIGNTRWADNGICANYSGDPSGWTHKLTICTKDSFHESAEHAAGFHDCSGCT